MKILKNNTPKNVPEWPKVTTCRNCGSELEIDKSDLHKGDVFYSQREIDYGATGFTCPCCNNFQVLK